MGPAHGGGDLTPTVKNRSRVLTSPLACNHSLALNQVLHKSYLPQLSSGLELLTPALPAHPPSLCLLDVSPEKQGRETANFTVSTFWASRKDRVLLPRVIGLQCCLIYVLLVLDI